MMNFKPLLLASLAALVMSSQSVQAQGYPYYNNGQYNAAPYANQYQNYNGYNRYNGYNQYNNSGYYPRQNNNSFFRKGPFGNNNSMPFTGNSGFGERFWPGHGSYYDDVLPANGPWNRSWGRAPWNRDYDNLWGRNGGPSKWFDPSDPEEGIAEAWEDMMITPNRLGTMPGGWKAPSISIPNPIDVETEFRDAAIDMPGEMQNFSEGFTYGGDDRYNDNSDRGSIGFGNKKKDKGITINSGGRR
ncbi:MAG: hypothetical protein GY744_01110 [Gammaproteobacteria bacterium]|nr:hypothetical protein [Gammaproteobacteria bacterium]